MIKYILKRVLLFFPTVFILSVIVFSVVHLAPGDPVQAMFGTNPRPEAIEKIRIHYGLDKPLIVQYGNWIKKIVKLDFGESIVRGDSIKAEIFKRYPRTLFISVEAIIIALFLSIPFALVSAKYHNSMVDIGISGVSLFFISMPEFWVGLVLLLLFGVILGFFPTTSAFLTESFADFLMASILPALSLGLIVFAQITRMLRTELVDNLNKEYILFARIKGISENRTLIFHNLRNSLITTSTVVGLQAGYLMGGVVIIERVYGFPGMGQFLLDGVIRRDYPVIQACTLVFVLTFVIVNLSTDIFYAFLDRRIRYT
jgi:peptide/nickel transport system permease protein